MLPGILGKPLITLHKDYIALPIYSQMILQNVDKAQIKLSAKKDNVAGVTLPIFEPAVAGTSSE